MNKHTRNTTTLVSRYFFCPQFSLSLRGNKTRQRRSTKARILRNAEVLRKHLLNRPLRRRFLHEKEDIQYVVKQSFPPIDFWKQSSAAFVAWLFSNAAAMEGTTNENWCKIQWFRLVLVHSLVNLVLWISFESERDSVNAYFFRLNGKILFFIVHS